MPQKSKRPSSFNIAVGNRIKQIRASNPGLPQKTVMAMAMASKQVSGKGMYMFYIITAILNGLYYI